MLFVTETCKNNGHQWCSRSYCQCFCHDDQNSRKGIASLEQTYKVVRGQKELRYEHADHRRY